MVAVNFGPFPWKYIGNFDDHPKIDEHSYIFQDGVAKNHQPAQSIEGSPQNSVGFNTFNTNIRRVGRSNDFDDFDVAS